VSQKYSRRTVLSSLTLGLAGFLPRGAGAQLQKADKIMVWKGRRVLQLMRAGTVMESFRIALGEHPIGPKLAKHDGRTPEGYYMVDGLNPHSPYFLSLHLNYPNAFDRLLAEEEGVEPGGDIAIHGMPLRYGYTDPVGYFRDWTDGCISVGNKSIERIFFAVDVGTPVEIRA